MKLTLLRSVLRDLVKGARKLGIARHTLPILQQVHFEHASNGIITAATTNLEETLQYQLNTTPIVGPPGAMLVPFAELNTLAKNGSKHDEIVFTAEDNQLTIANPINDQSMQHTVETPDLDEWPNTVVPTTELADCDLADFLAGYRCCSKAASNDTSRTVLNSVYWDHEETHLVATDGHRMATQNCADLPLTDSVILPITKVLTTKLLDPVTNGRVALQSPESAGRFILQTGPWTYSCKLIEGRYPNYGQVIPDLGDYPNTVEIHNDDVDAIRAWHRQAPGKANGSAMLYCDPDRVLLLGRHEDEFLHLALPKSEAAVSEPLVVAFDRQYLVDALTTEYTTLRIKDRLAPVHCSQDTGIHVIMPQRGIDSGVVINYVQEQFQGTPVHTEPTPEPESPVTPEPEPDKEPAMPDNETKETTTDSSTSNEPTDPIEDLLDQIDTVYDDLRNAAQATKALKKVVREIKRNQKTKSREHKSAMELINKLQKIAA